MTRSVIAHNRFGLGARSDDGRINDPQRWLRQQLSAYDPVPALLDTVPSRRTVVDELADFYVRRRNGFGRGQGGNRGEQEPTSTDMDGETVDPRTTARRSFNRQGRQHYAAMVDARARIALTSRAPFAERLVHFWANHFAVSANGAALVRLAGLLEFEAVRPHVMGRFRDMLLAVERHPAMLLFLNQARSIGPNSPFGRRVGRRRNRRPGLNENLAREIMELHTLGVDGGYSQADVTELARAMTGWTVAGLARGPVRRIFPTSATVGQFYFAQQLHEPGPRTLLGRHYSAGGEAQAVAILEDLSAHPSTARHLATKLARHFAGDTPPDALVDRLATTYRGTEGDLPSLYRVLIDAPECWVDEPVKFKTPWEWIISGFRALGSREFDRRINGVLRQLGQPVWTPGSPAGFDDIAASWSGASALTSRVELAQRIADRSRDRIDARQLAPRLFGDMLSDRTARTIASAESAGQGLALLLVSPEFLRR
ncbi:MAG: DUF1800 domain-containing protein [Pseudomonadota bacterium]